MWKQKHRLQFINYCLLSETNSLYYLQRSRECELIDINWLVFPAGFPTKCSTLRSVRPYSVIILKHVIFFPGKIYISAILMEMFHDINKNNNKSKQRNKQTNKKQTLENKQNNNNNDNNNKQTKSNKTSTAYLVSNRLGERILFLFLRS